MKPYEQLTTRKILLGYILLILIAVGAVIYLFNITKRLANEDDINSVPREKIYLVTNILSLVYESETMGQLLNTEDGEDFTYFNETLDKAHANIDSLRLLVTDTLQLLKIDTIDMLLERKRANTSDLLGLIKEANADLYAKRINNALAKGAELIEEITIQERSDVQQDTVVVERQKRNFIRRVANVFRPEVVDTAILVSANQQVQKDTIVNVYDPFELLSSTLQDIRRAVANEQKQMREVLINRSPTLRYDNSMITSRINQILRDMEEEEMEASFARMQERQDLVEDTSNLINFIGLITIFVTLAFIYFIMRDISKSRFYRQQLEKAKTYAEKLLQARERLIMTISHDIRAPLSSIIGYIELLLRSNPNKQQQQYLKNMSGSSAHILSLVNDLLDFESLETGKMELHKVAFKLSDLFREIYESFKPQASAKGLELVLDIKGDPEKISVGDVVRIRQIVGNLVSNAIKFTSKGQVVITIDCSQLATTNEDENGETPSKLILTVTDTGAGIPQEEQKKIFGEFARLAGSEKTEGFGLGLSITNRLVALMDGELLLQSVPGEGSTFTVVLPLPLAENQSVSEVEVTANEEKSVAFSGKNITCLLVDDDLLQLALMEAILKQNNIRSVSCTNPQAVMELLRTDSFDIVLTDIQMPEMDGYALVKQIRGSDLPDAKTLPVVVLSATVGENKKVYHDAGFTDSLSKPFTTEQLVTLLNQIFPEEIKKKNLNTGALTAFAANDKNASASILKTFSAETNKSITLLQGALEKNDRKEAARLAHKLIPLFTMLGANILVQHLRILERNDFELTDSGWMHLLTDVIRQASSIVEEVESSVE
ncbi:ATP-binding protein [Parabacteroides sp. PF5-9]|uniref:ATP-binding response regulator n=1 Tax=Parabacteroides sp. PF5-9 TaxID=1742404 RepID=UPI00247672EC|nr:ATP-binding protein [Parabacteroides sp. PF5-9]MDH6358767.1 signal transduction histidine kinase/CheY-like chemotaxis protein [Parabacteroides sp. PF5-9]